MRGRGKRWGLWRKGRQIESCFLPWLSMSSCHPLPTCSGKHQLDGRWDGERLGPWISDCFPCFYVFDFFFSFLFLSDRQQRYPVHASKQASKHQLFSFLVSFPPTSFWRCSEGGVRDTVIVFSLSLFSTRASVLFS